MTTSKETYVIIGFGWVGQANALAIKMLGFDVSYFDPATPPHHYPRYAHVYDSLERLASVESKDSVNTWYIVCVGDRVSPEGVQDISNIKSALDSLAGFKGGIILRSTILPDLLETLPFDFYVPEFLHEKKAVEECVVPHFFVVGSKGSRTQPSVFREWRKTAGKTFEGSPREASFIKYLSNIWNAMRIALVNEFGDAINRPDNKKALDENARVIDFLFDGHSYLRYGRAFGGHCLPKDTRAFRHWYEQKNIELPLIAGAYRSNALHEKLEQEFPLLPEWFSEWDQPHISGWQAFSELWYAVKKHLTRPSLVFKQRKNR
mgnify:CR=1 FL=1